MLGPNRRKLAGWAIAVIWGLGLVFWPHELREAIPTQDIGSSSEGLYKASLTRANFGMLGFQLFESKDGKKSSKIASGFAELHREGNFVFMREVDAQFFAQTTGNVVVAQSRFGRSYMDSNQVDLEEDVSIISRRGYLFNMDFMTYDANNHEFHSKSAVYMKGPKVSRPTMYLQGVGLLSHIDSEHFILKRKVRGKRRLKTSEWLRISSKAGEFFADEQRAIFIGNAVSRLPDLRIDSDLFEISISRGREILHARGNVRVNHGERTGFANRAFIEVGSNKIILEGEARLDAKGNRVQGSKIVLHTDDDRISVESAKGKMQQ